MVLFSLGGDVRKLIKVEDKTTEGVVFNLHCKITALLLFSASAVVSMRVYTGDGPMQCIAQTRGSFHSVMETFCWVTSTFTVVVDPARRDPTENFDAPDIHPTRYKPHEKVYHAYYQWVCFILFFQAVLFYAPKWLWKQSEGGLMEILRGDSKNELTGEKERHEWKNIIAKYFIDRLEGYHNDYTYTYWKYEFLCLVNVLVQACALNAFFGGKGFRGVYDLYARKFRFPGTDTMEEFFPLKTKCLFSSYGLSGTLEQRDALCILALNVYNRYIFSAMWYWFLILILAFTSLIIHRGLVISSPWCRSFLLRVPDKKNLIQREIRYVTERVPISTWWVLYLLKSNIDPILYKELIQELSLRLRSSKTK